MPIQQIPKNNISDTVLEQFKKAISSGEWMPGSKIPSENELAARMGVSRISVRSALQKLSILGVVESRQGEGTYVCELNSGLVLNSLVPVMLLRNHDMQHVLEFRKLLECGGAALAAQRADSEDVARLEENYATLTKLQHDSPDRITVDWEFHFLIAQATKNPMITQVFLVIKDVLIESMREIAKLMTENNALRYHRDIIEAIKFHTPVLAQRLMEEHLQETLTFVTKAKDQTT
ncbi:MAG: FadR/GntR family transcriptional regulator [Oscillospiraceae bacterium]